MERVALLRTVEATQTQTEPASRPSINPDWRKLLLAAMAEGTPLRTACQAEGMPRFQVVYREAARDEAFDAALSEARVKLCEKQQDEIDALAASATAANWQIVRLQIDTLKWKLSKVLPKLYGDRPAETHVNTSVNNFVVLTPEKIADYQESRRAALAELSATKVNALRPESPEPGFPTRS